MKIAFVYDAVYPFIKGGAEKRFFEIGKRLSSSHEIHFFGMKSWPGANTMKQNNCTYHACQEKTELYNKDGKRKISQAISFSLQLFPELLKNDFDIIDCSSFPYFPIFSAKIACFLKRKPLIVTWHEVWGPYWKEYIGPLGFFGKAIEKIASKLPDKIIAVSEKTKKGLVAIGVKPEKISIIPNGIDFNEINSISPAKTGYDIVFAGRLIKEKNASLLVDAVKLLKEKQPTISCAIIGNGPEFTALQNFISTSGLEKNISLLGFLDYQQMISTFKASKLFAFPSIREGFGISILEANACGLPALVCDHDNNAATDLIDWSDNGFIVEPDSGQFASAINSMTKRKWNTTAITNKAKQFDWNNLTQLALKTYEETK